MSSALTLPVPNPHSPVTRAYLQAILLCRKDILSFEDGRRYTLSWGLSITHKYFGWQVQSLYLYFWRFVYF
jgi:hypothetical protein